MKTTMHHIIKNGLPICEEGPVIIEGVEHYVKGGFVSCSSSLNHKAWNITKKEKQCAQCAALNQTGQLKLEL